ncbi:hypothetical protein ACQCVO_25675, partial [Bacillus infantis]|uniref:hypothetical protein n=1 Tax=Bacillus infantis TaxID=324767 RepID=UPI003CF5647F
MHIAEIPKNNPITLLQECSSSLPLRALKNLCFFHSKDGQRKNSKTYFGKGGIKCEKAAFL